MLQLFQVVKIQLTKHFIMTVLEYGQYMVIDVFLMPQQLRLCLKGFTKQVNLQAQVLVVFILQIVQTLEILVMYSLLLVVYNLIVVLSTVHQVMSVAQL